MAPSKAQHPIEQANPVSQETDVQDGVIRKMLRDPPKPSGRFAALLLELAPDIFRRAAKSAHDLNLVVSESEVNIRTAAEALSELPEKRMTAIWDHDSEELALLVFDATLLDALIEQQTLGEVLTTSRVERPVTDIDRAMSEPFQRAVLEQMKALTKDRSDGKILGKFKPLRMETDPVRLSLDLISQAYEVLCVSLDLGPGRKTGAVQFLVPLKDALGDAQTKPAQADPAMMALLHDVEVPLEVSLPSLKISVKKLMGLQPDSTVPIDPEILRISEVCDVRGTLLTKAHLGQLNGVRAVRMDLAPSPTGTPQAAALAEFEDGSVSMVPPIGPGGDMPAGLPNDLDMPDLPDMDAMGDAPLATTEPMAGDLADLDMTGLDLPGLDLGGDLGGDMPDLDMPDLDMPDLAMPDLDLSADLDLGGMPDIADLES